MCSPHRCGIRCVGENSFVPTENDVMRVYNFSVDEMTEQCPHLRYNNNDHNGGGQKHLDLLNNSQSKSIWIYITCHRFASEIKFSAPAAASHWKHLIGETQVHFYFEVGQSQEMHCHRQHSSKSVYREIQWLFSVFVARRFIWNISGSSFLQSVGELVKELQATWCTSNFSVK